MLSNQYYCHLHVTNIHTPRLQPTTFEQCWFQMLSLLVHFLMSSPIKTQQNVYRMKAIIQTFYNNKNKVTHDTRYDSCIKNLAAPPPSHKSSFIYIQFIQRTVNNSHYTVPNDRMTVSKWTENNAKRREHDLT